MNDLSEYIGVSYVVCPHIFRGTVMVGAAYAIDRTYFEEMGTYDEGMKVWGGENLEMAWRVSYPGPYTRKISPIILVSVCKIDTRMENIT